MNGYCVYIMTNRTRTTLYIGMTGNLERRVAEHKSGTGGFSRLYRTTLLMHFECCDNVNEAIAREKQLKGWSRAKKDALIAVDNPERIDLAIDWLAPIEA